MPVDCEKRRFTVSEYHRLADTGILSENDRVELIAGEILRMTPVGSRHAAAVARATRALVLAAGTQAIVRVQSPIRSDDFTEPEPDLVLVRPRDDFYSAEHPRAADVLLVIEIADSSLSYDREMKARLYARAGIAEYWLSDLSGRTVTAYSAPQDGAYRAVATHAAGERLSSRQLQDCSVLADDLMAN
jgi:Uma2 family endonuclease